MITETMDNNESSSEMHRPHSGPKKVAVTGATGFIGGHLARFLLAKGHDVVGITRKHPRSADHALASPDCPLIAASLHDVDALSKAFRGCFAVAHCAGVNRNRGADTFDRVHVQATHNIIEAAKRAGVRRIAITSFLRARPNCGSAYHESKFQAEQIIRASGLDHTILKCGVTYGRGDHMLDHLSHALHTFPVFGLVGMRDQDVRPVAVQDAVRVLEASLFDDRLKNKTVAVVGPTTLTLGNAVRAVADVIDRHPLFVRLPLAFHYPFAWLMERCMTIPMVSVAQVRILSEGVAEPWGKIDELPNDLKPATPFSATSIRRGLPAAGRFGLRDCRCLTRWFTA